MASFNNVNELIATLETKTVSEMRTFARTEFSIVPGTKKKEELKAEIVAVYLGEKTPEKPRKSGRPTLNSNVVEKEVDDIKQPEVEFYTNHEETLQEEEDDYTV
ncbi:MAG: hypothetical protein J6R37_01875, partial [Clostridia bacterium]|nr:hypothetical protein [Clostridia bacterium]